ncbi:MAG TPA: response regulator transcription factor [Candidatus Eisenbacteria bacterium]|nr:response regulator transcription factor [Candidatus Eisenbacteria bacterium]
MVAIQILIVDDFEHWRNSVRSMLKRNPRFRVVGEGRDGIEAVDKAATLRPHVVLLDIGMPRLNGIEAAKRIRKACPESKIIFLTQEDSSDIQSAALDTGAVAYLLKATAGSKLLPAIERAMLLEGTQALQPECPTREHVILTSEC